MSKWEYMCLEWYSSKQMNTNMLNALGGDGWELIQIVNGEAVLKRKLKEEKKSEKEENLFDSDDNFVDMIYSLYPTKCPKRGTSLGKSKKDKERIRKLLKTYTKEQIESVVRKEVDAKYNKEYMQNFSTFLNNFPDPNAIEQDMFVGMNLGKRQSLATGDMVINGVIYR